jgi:hypothetical protein
MPAFASYRPKAAIPLSAQSDHYPRSDVLAAGETPSAARLVSLLAT